MTHFEYIVTYYIKCVTTSLEDGIIWSYTSFYLYSIWQKSGQKYLSLTSTVFRIPTLLFWLPGPILMQSERRRITRARCNEYTGHTGPPPATASSLSADPDTLGSALRYGCRIKDSHSHIMQNGRRERIELNKYTRHWDLCPRLHSAVLPISYFVALANFSN